MRAVQLHGTVKKIQQLVRLSKQALREGAYQLRRSRRGHRSRLSRKAPTCCAKGRSDEGARAKPLLTVPLREAI